MQQQLINIDPELMGGTPVFMGTRVPVKTLFEYIETGDNVDKFLDEFPSVSKEQAINLLDLAFHLLLKNNQKNENIA